MYCKNCGEEISRDRKNCPYCGVSIRKNDIYGSAKQIRNRRRRKPVFKKAWFWMSMILLILLIMAGILFTKRFGKSEKGSDDKTREKVETPISLEEAGGFAAWKEDGFSKMVRTDLVMKLPVEEENDTKCTALIKTAEENVIAIMQEDGAEVKDWNWMNNVETQEIVSDKASFKATLAYTGEETEERYPIFFVSDIENYSLSGKEDNVIEDENEYIFPESDSRFLSEEEVVKADIKKLPFGRNEIYARHGYIFNNKTYQAYFEKTSWYKGTVPSDQFDEDVFNEYEKQNVKLIKQVEDEYNGASEQQSGQQKAIEDVYDFLVGDSFHMQESEPVIEFQSSDTLRVQWGGEILDEYFDYSVSARYEAYRIDGEKSWLTYITIGGEEYFLRCFDNGTMNLSSESESGVLDAWYEKI